MQVFNQFSVVGSFVSAHKVVNKQSECFKVTSRSSSKFLSIKISFVWGPTKILSLIFALHCTVHQSHIENLLHFDQCLSQNLSSVQACSKVEVAIFSVGSQVGHLQRYFAQEVTA
jgi:hypothetical protein